MQIVRIYIETYGCTLNKADSAYMMMVLQRVGHTITDRLDDADVVIVNTCTVRKDTEDKVLARIKALNRIAKHKGFKLVVAGCMAKAQPYIILKNAPNASLVSPQNVSRIVEVVECSERKVLIDGERKDTSLVPIYFKDKTAAIPIAEGCLGNCSYCIVKIARGTLQSYPPKAIVEAVRKAVSNGVVEIQITAQDTAAYGRDIGYNLPRLLNDIVKVEGDFKVRVGMMNVNLALDFIDELIEVYKHPKIYKFLHIPVQSGDNRVLKLMNRKYTVEEYVEFVKEFKRRIPGIAIATDIIVGHPGEDEEAFNNTLKLVKELEFDRVHIAHYSIRPHTLSARLQQVPGNVKKERVLKLTRLVEEICSRKFREYVGKEVNVIFTEKSFRGDIVGRMENYYPVVVKGSSDILGLKGVVKVVDSSFYDLRGDIVKVSP